MKLSASVQMVWQLAAREAVAAGYRDIEPEHFLAALLKFAEVPPEELASALGSSDAAAVIADDIRRVKQTLQELSVDTRSARHEIRTRLGAGGQAYTGGVVHRSQSTRALFDAAVTAAERRGEDSLAAPHLLQVLLAAPSPVMTKVLGDRLRRASDVAARSVPGRVPRAAATEGTTGKDLPGELAIAARSIAQCLVQGKRPAIVVVSESSEPADVAIRAATGIVSSGEGGKGRKMQVVDATDCGPTQEDDGVGRVVEAVAAVQGQPESVLYLPSFAGVMAVSGGKAWLEAVKEALQHKSTRCIAHVTAAGRSQLVDADGDWTRLLDTIWLLDTQLQDVPLEV